MPQKENKYHPAPKHELPGHLLPVFKKATRLEWITIIYLVTVVVLMNMVMGSSQAMKAAWLEDTLSMIPAISFLVARRYYDREPNRNYPYGHHRAFSIAFQLGAFALLSIGLFVLYDSIITLVKQERPGIGSIQIFGRQIWMGWIMILVLLYSSVPSIILGIKKIPLSKKLHNKILFTDAHTQQADWQTAFAAILGIIGIGFGLWWTDAVAAIFIAVSIVIDGAQRLKGAVQDLLDQTPTNIENTRQHTAVNKVYDYFKKLPWVKDVRIRMREAGEIFYTEVFVIPTTETGIIKKMAEASKEAKKLDWKIHDVIISPIAAFDEEQDDTDDKK